MCLPYVIRWGKWKLKKKEGKTTKITKRIKESDIVDCLFKSHTLE